MKEHTINDRWQFLLSPEETWDALYTDCKAATHSIKMEQYILQDDPVGRRFLTLFVEKARQGLEVRILCDDVGSHSLRRSKLVNRLRASGGVLDFYNSPKLIDLFKPGRFFPRTHMKAAVIDGKIGYIGGVCIAQRMEKWRDTQLRITTAVVCQLESALDTNSSELVPTKPLKGKGPHTSISRGDDFNYIQNDPGFFRHPIYYELLHHILHAKKTIYISAAFFVPTRKLRRYLKHAARRGVDVILLVPQRSDFWIADWACLSYLPRLLKHGVRVFLYQPVVLHTKTTVIDGKWGTVGSCNMDPLSFFHNREGNLVIANTEALEQMKKDYLADLEHSLELTLATYKQISLWKRIIAHIARLLRPIL